jgi:hypothetical protein
VCQQHPATPAAAQQAARDQQPDEPAILFTAFLVRLFALFGLLVLTPALVQEVGEKHPATTAAAQQAAGHDQANDPAILIAFLLALILDLFALLRRLAPLMEEAREQQPAQTPTAQKPAPRKQAGDAFVVDMLAGAVDGFTKVHELSPSHRFPPTLARRGR